MEGFKEHIFNVSALRKKALGDVSHTRIFDYMHHGLKTVKPEERKALIECIQSESKRLIEYIKKTK